MRLLSTMAAAAVATLVATPALAQSDYLCAGVSENERQEAERFDYTLKMVYAQPDGHFLADVQTRITDSSGAVLVDVLCGGPWLLASLPSGSYEVEATFQGETKSTTVSVDGTAGQEQLITF
ncbi:MAG: hypothetical protein ACFCVH_07110 [Alphaproteobacteria bacterium]